MSITALGPDSMLDGHLQYRNKIKIRVDVECFGSRFKELVLPDPYSTQPLGIYPIDPSHLLLTGTAFCSSCTMTQDADIGQRCSPHTFSLPPSKKGVLLSFDDYNTQYSQVVAFMIPFRHRKPSHDRWSRCDSESLMSVFSSMPSSIY